MSNKRQTKWERRRFLEAVSAASGAGVLAGCQGLDSPTKEETVGGGGSTERDITKPSLFIANLVPTVMYQVDGETWIPRLVGSRGEEFWEVAVEMGDAYNPGLDRLKKGQVGRDPPSWLSDVEINDSRTYFKVPGRLLTVTSGPVTRADFPTNPQVGTDVGADGGVEKVMGELSTAADGHRSYEMVIEGADFGELEATSLNRFTLGAQLQSDSRFADDIGGYPGWSNQRITSKTTGKYGAVDTSAEEGIAALEAGFKQLVKFMINTVLLFRSGAKIYLADSLFGQFAKTSLIKIGFKGGKKLNEELGITTQAYAIAKDILGEDQLYDPSNLSVDEAKTVYSSAKGFSGTMVTGPLNAEMRDHRSLDDMMARTDGQTRNNISADRITAAGVGLSGPMMYLRDTDFEPQTPIPKSNAPAQFDDIALNSPEGQTFGRNVPVEVVVSNIGQTAGTFTDTLTVSEGAADFSTDVSLDVLAGRTSRTTVEFQPPVADTYTFELADTDASTTTFVGGPLAGVGETFNMSEYPAPSDPYSSTPLTKRLKITLDEVKFQQSFFVEGESLYSVPTMFTTNQDPNLIFVRFMLTLENVSDTAVEVPQSLFEPGNDNARFLSKLTWSNGESERPLSQAQIPYTGIWNQPPVKNLELGAGQSQQAWLLATAGMDTARGIISLQAQVDSQQTPPEWEWFYSDNAVDTQRGLPEYELVSLEAPDTVSGGNSFDITATVKNTGDGTGIFRGELQGSELSNNLWERQFAADQSRVVTSFDPGETETFQFTVDTSASGYSGSEEHRLGPFFDTARTTELR